jgi:hypothetical protein
VYYTPEVFGPLSNGSYAEYHVAKADILAKIRLCMACFSTESEHDWRR